MIDTPAMCGRTESGLYFTDAFSSPYDLRILPDRYYPLDVPCSSAFLSKWKITEKRKVLSSGLR
jgi:hypothetical protein